MKKGSFISTILKSNKTVFSFKDIVLFWQETKTIPTKARVNYYVRNGGLLQLRRGLYAKDKNYNKYELATKIYTPSYISLETVLKDSGMIFQNYTSIFVVSYKTKGLIIDNQNYSFKQIKKEILTNPAGIKEENNYHIASVERAFLDILYLNKDYYFDNLSPLNWDQVNKILPIYGNNRRIIKKVKELELLAKQKIK